MKTVSCWNDLKPFGIDPLTGEACGLMHRILFDLTAQGQEIVEKALGCGLNLSEPWNRGDPPHVGSILLPQDMFVTLAIFALLETGCTEAWLYGDHCLLGIGPGDDYEQLRAIYDDRSVLRTYRYGGTAGSRNVHVMSGRTE